MSTPTIAAEAASPLLFNWDSPRRRRVTIIICLIASLLGHVFCFYLFQIVYPTTVTILPPPVRVSLVSAATEEGKSLLRWIEAEDPALAFATQRPPDARLRALPKLEHVPSYLANEPVLQQIPPVGFDLHIPSAQAPGPVPVLRDNKPSQQPVVTPTTVVFSAELAGFGPPKFSPMQFTASNREPPEAVRFRVAVNPRGEVHYCLPMNSSGDPALDEQARRNVVLCRFTVRSTTAAPDELTWGVATVQWGNDIAPPQPTTPPR